MRFISAILLSSVFAFGIAQSHAQTDTLDELFELLQTSNPAETRIIERRISKIWSDSGSRIINEMMNQALFAIERRRYSNAISLLNKITSVTPHYAEGWNARATVHYLAGNYINSINDINRTLDLNPRHFKAINGLGLILEILDYKALALKAYLEVYKLSPNRLGIKEAIARLQKEIYLNTI